MDFEIINYNKESGPLLETIQEYVNDRFSNLVAGHHMTRHVFIIAGIKALEMIHEDIINKVGQTWEIEGIPNFAKYVFRSPTGQRFEFIHNEQFDNTLVDHSIYKGVPRSSFNMDVYLMGERIARFILADPSSNVRCPKCKQQKNYKRSDGKTPICKKCNTIMIAQ